MQWLAQRTYDPRTSGPGETVQGYNWFHGYLQSLTLADPDNAPASAVTWRLDAHRTFTFSNSGSYTFGANDRTFAVLSHAHAGDPNDTYRLAFLDGSLMLFWIIEDFLWFVLNPAYGLARFTPVQIPWHHHWLFGVPTEIQPTSRSPGPQ